MLAILSAVARLIGIGGILFIGLLLYEEGIPGAHRIPFLTGIPIIGDLTAGRVHTYAAQQVTLATSNMVTKFERDTIASQLAEMERQRNAATQATEEHRRRLVAAEAAEQTAKDTLENEIQSYELQLSEKNRACAVTAADRQWLLRH
ncbi:MAG: hypothetical protein ACJ8EW_04185 [Rhizobium sp.]|uniref:hypothetical protein n=1 Tax=Rhizobium sp. TaxID=391 RepID=UPI00389A1C79